MMRAIISKNKFELFIENWSYSYNKYERLRALGTYWYEPIPRGKGITRL